MFGNKPTIFIIAAQKIIMSCGAEKPMMLLSENSLLLKILP